MEPHPRRPPEPAVTLDDIRMALQLTARGGTLRAIRTTVRTGQNQRLSGGRRGGEGGAERGAAWECGTPLPRVLQRDSGSNEDL